MWHSVRAGYRGGHVINWWSPEALLDSNCTHTHTQTIEENDIKRLNTLLHEI